MKVKYQFYRLRIMLFQKETCPYLFVYFIFLFFFLDIPEESPILNLDKMVHLDTSQLHTETTGKKIIKQLQEYLLSKVSADERAVLPENKIQRLLGGVIYCPSICFFPFLIFLF